MHLWDTADPTRRTTVEAHRNAVNAAVFSPDGHLLATGGADRALKPVGHDELGRADPPRHRDRAR
ncbi:hypothetical protein [Saccharothrix stipae]